MVSGPNSFASISQRSENQTFHILHLHVEFPVHRRPNFLVGPLPPPNSAGSTVLNPLRPLGFLAGRSGECSSITSTISSSLGGSTCSSTITVSSSLTTRSLLGGLTSDITLDWLRLVREALLEGRLL